MSIHPQAQPTASKFVEVNGVRLHYLSQGSGPMLLMLHGFPEFSGMWQPYLDALSDSYQVVAPDLRGYNLSTQPKELADYDLPLLAQDVAALPAALGAETAYLVGHDWGGLLAWYVADYHPGVFRKLAIMNGPHPAIYQDLLLNDPDQKSKAAYIDLLLSPTAEGVLLAQDFKALRASVFGGSSHPFSEDERQAFLAAWSRGLTGPLNYYRSYIPQQERHVAALKGITCPTLVMWGQGDKSISEHNLVGLERHAPSLRIQRYPEATHWLPHEIPQLLIKELRTFMR